MTHPNDGADKPGADKPGADKDASDRSSGIPSVRGGVAPELAVLHPLFLKLGGRDVLVVGAGRVAERKIAELVEAQARVKVVAPEATDTVKALAAARAVRWEQRAFEPGDIEGAWLVVAATGVSDVQRAIADLAEERRTFTVAVDDKANASAYGCATVRRGAVTIAISTAGESPALARLIREVLEHALPETEWIDAARALRDRWRADGTPFESRFGELVKNLKERLRVE